MKFGLGFGLNKNNFLGGGSDPIIEALIKANCTMYLDPNKADGTSKGINAPLTTPLKDLIGSNDATLVNFAGTPTSGYDDLTLPNTNVKTFLKADGVDDYCTIADDVSIDPTGTEDFAICGVFKTDSILPDTYRCVFSKLESSTQQAQIAIYTRPQNLNGFELRVGGTRYTTSEVLQAETVYSFQLTRINGKLTFKVNQIISVDTLNTTTLISQPNVRVFAKSSNAEGTSHNDFSEVYLGYLAFFYNGATGLNETDVDNACALLRAPYF